MATTALPADTPGAPPARRGPREWPLVVPWLAAASVLAVFQAVFLTWRFQPLGGGAQMLVGVAKFGILAAFLTALLALPAVLLLRRLHPRWPDDRRAASVAAVVGLVAALCAWLVVDRWLIALAAPWWLQAPLEVVTAVGAGVAVAWLHLPRAWIRAGALAAPLLLAFLCVPMPGGGLAPPRAEPVQAAAPARVSASRPDVVLVTIDTLRADRVGPYRALPSITPEMDRVFREGVSFERVVAASPWTIPSVASILTGLPTLGHHAGLPLGPGRTFFRSPLAPEHTTLAERFAAAGYRTRAVVANGFLGSQFGMDQGFQELANPFGSAMGSVMMRDLPLPRLIVGLTPPKVWGDYRAAGVTDTAVRWLADESEAPLFLWVHYIEPHTPLQADPSRLDPSALLAMVEQSQPPVLADGTVVGDVFVETELVRSGMLWLGPADRRRIEEYYDRAVRYLDGHLGRLFAGLRERSRRRPLVAAMTADHGEELWDHGHYEHGHDYYREVTRAPLVFWGPGRLPAGRSVPELAGLVDVGPTLLALAGLEPPAPGSLDEGRSLVGSWTSRPDPAAPPRFSEGNLYDLPAVLVEEGSWRFLLRANGVEELYHAADDPQERRNLVLEQPERSRLYRRMLEPRLNALLGNASAAGPIEISAETLQSLRALGYVR